MKRCTCSSSCVAIIHHLFIFVLLIFNLTDVIYTYAYIFIEDNIKLIRNALSIVDVVNDF